MEMNIKCMYGLFYLHNPSRANVSNTDVCLQSVTCVDLVYKLEI